MKYIYSALFSFCLGSIPFAYIVGFLVGHVDIRTIGSKNAGAGNVFHLFGVFPGLMALSGDLLKGFIPLLVCQELFSFKAYELAILGLFAVLGHVFSPFLKFKGGKGVATTVGVFLFIIYNSLKLKGIYLLGILILIWLLLLLITHSQVVSLAIIFPIFPFLLYIFTNDLMLFLITVIFVVILEYFGRESFKRELKASYEKYLKRFFKRRNF